MRCPLTVRALLLVGVLIAMISGASPANAVLVPRPGGPAAPPGDATELVMTGFGHGQGLIGGVPDHTPFDPLAGYPDTAQFRGPLPPGFIEQNEDFAGTITAASADGAQTAVLYCIDLHATTYAGLGYRIGPWDRATVPNVGYVARALISTYPAVPGQPAGLQTDDQRAATVQAAIWFFTDDYVLDRDDPLRKTVSALVAAVLVAGPVVQPPLPALSIDPAASSAPAGAAAGPYTVQSDADATVTVNSTGGSMFTDAAGQHPVAQGARVSHGEQVFLRAPGAGAAQLRATAVQTVRTGSVYLYDGNAPDVTTAQKLVLASTAQVQVRAVANADFLPPGAVAVSTLVTGAAAGHQDAATLILSCTGRPDEQINVAAGTTGASTHEVPGIPAGSRCTVSEPTTGATPEVDVAVDISPPGVVTVPAGGTVTVAVVNTVTALTGSILVDTTIAGAAAADHGPIVELVSCAGRPIVSIPIPAGALTVTPVTVTAPVGTECIVTEPIDGSSDTVSATVDVDPSLTIVPSGDPAVVEVGNTYQPVVPTTTPTTTPTTVTTASPSTSTTRMTSTSPPIPTSSTATSGSVAPTSTTTDSTQPTTTVTSTASTTTTTTTTTATTTRTTSNPHVLPDTGTSTGLLSVSVAAVLGTLLGGGLLMLGRRPKSMRHR